MSVPPEACPNENQALVDPSGDGPYTLSATIPSIPATTSATTRMASIKDPELVVTSSNQVVRPTGAMGSRTPSAPSVPTKLPIGSHTATTGIVGSSPSSAVAHTFHVSHNLPHGASFQTHGSVLPVLPVPSRAATHESPVEPIGVVAAGEADFSLDECEDRMLKWGFKMLSRVYGFLFGVGGSRGIPLFEVIKWFKSKRGGIEMNQNVQSLSR